MKQKWISVEGVTRPEGQTYVDGAYAAVEPTLEERLLHFARSLRTAAHFSTSGYYSTEAESAVTAAKSEVYSEIALMLDVSLDFDSALSPADCRKMRGY